jgi:hypothetical protein
MVLIHFLCNGDETQKLWKPLLTQFSLQEAHRNGLPIELESDSISGWNRTKNKKIINPVDKVNSKWYIYKRRKC